MVDDLSAGMSIAAVAARDCSAASLNALLHLSSGPVRVILSPERADLFQLEAMNNRRASDAAIGSASHLTPIELVSVEARSGVHSGISAHDRATTVATLGSASPNPRDLVSPGHVFPRLGAQGGLLERADAYQAALEIASNGGGETVQDIPAACVELLNDAGSAASPSEAQALAASRGLTVYSLTELVRKKLISSPLVSRHAQSVLPIEDLGTFHAILFRDHVANREHLALVRGDTVGAPDAALRLKNSVPVVRIHRRQLWEDVFGAARPSRLRRGLERIAACEHGVFLYLDGAAAQNSFEPMRDYAIGAQILVDLGVTQARIITDSSHALAGSTVFGVTVHSQEPLTPQGHR